MRLFLGNERLFVLNFTIQPYQQIFLASNQFSLLLTKPANLNTYFISRINIPG